MGLCTNGDECALRVKLPLCWIYKFGLNLSILSETNCVPVSENMGSASENGPIGVDFGFQWPAGKAARQMSWTALQKLAGLADSSHIACCGGGRRQLAAGLPP